MSNVAAQINADDKEDKEGTMLLGAHVPSSLYWKFKAVAGQRKEKMMEAVMNAAMLYIDVPEGGNTGE